MVYRSTIIIIMKKYLIAVILLSSCKATKYVVTPMTMTVKDGKPSFTPIGQSQLLKDTTLNVLLISKRN